jgi:phenylacetate-CoA oxygenase PaaI subunit
MSEASDGNRVEGTEEVAPPRSAVQEFSVENDDALAALVNLIAVLGDNEYFLGRRVSEWADAGPLLESAVACAAISQDTLGRSRAIYPLLEELPWANPPTALQGERDRSRRYSVSFLDDPFSSWSNVVAALALISPALSTVFESVTDSAYEALARRARRILEEERLTSAYAAGLVRQIASTDRGLELLQQRVDELFTEMLCWFGPPGEPGLEVLKSEGLVSRTNEEMRQIYLGRVVPVLQEVNVEVPVQWNEGEKRWEYGELPWNEWNQLQRRLERPLAKSGA